MGNKLTVLLRKLVLQWEDATPMKRIVSLLLTALVFARIWKSRTVRYIRWIVRSHRILKKLPTPSSSLLPEGLILGQLGSPEILKLKSSGPLYTVGERINNVSKNLVETIMKLSRSDELKNEGIITLWGMKSPLNWTIPNVFAVVAVTDVELLRYMLSAKGMVEFEKGISYEISEPLIGAGVLSTSGPKWWHQRRIIELAFKRPLIKASNPLVLQTANELIDKWNMWLDQENDQTKELNIHEEMLKLTIDVLGRVAFSANFGSVSAKTTADAPFYDAFDFVIKTIADRCMLTVLHTTRHMPTATNLHFDASLAKIKSAVQDLIRQRIHERCQDVDGGKAREENPADLLDMMLAGSKLTTDKHGNLVEDIRSDVKKDSDFENVKQEDDYLSFQEISDSAQTMLFAGHDTTAAALSWLLHLLVSHPEKQSRLLAEINEFLPNGEDPDSDMIEKMNYLNACVKETLRLYPSAGFTRKAVRNTKLGKYTIPAGAELLVLPILMQRNEKYYKDPDSFMPERWLESGMKSGSLQADFALDSKSTALLPFSMGPRNCVGRPLALLELRVVTIKLLQTFNFELVNDPKFQTYPLITLTMNPVSIRLKVSKRN